MSEPLLNYKSELTALPVAGHVSLAISQQASLKAGMGYSQTPLLEVPL